MIGAFSEKMLIGILCFECQAYIDEILLGSPRLCNKCRNHDFCIVNDMQEAK